MKTKQRCVLVIEELFLNELNLVLKKKYFKCVVLQQKVMYYEKGYHLLDFSPFLLILYKFWSVFFFLCSSKKISREV